MQHRVSFVGALNTGVAEERCDVLLQEEIGGCVDPLDHSTLEPGVRFHDRYLILRCIKAGAMGAVYEVLDERTNSPRALKVMLPETIRSEDLRSRFALEAKITGCIESDHIIRVMDADVDVRSGMPFIVMDLLRGDDLRNILKRRGALPAEEVLTYFTQIALALEKTHASGIVHRDLKPDNLFLTMRDDGSPCVKILDFGIAKVIANTNEGGSTKPIGTPLYMSPEQIRGDGSLGPATDLYALGHIAFTLLVGKPYWYEDVQSSQEAIFTIIAKILSGCPDPPSHRARRYGYALPPTFDAWFHKITSPAPLARFRSATEAVNALSNALSARACPSMPSATFNDQAARRADSTVLDDSGTLSSTSKTEGSLQDKRPRDRRKIYIALIAATALGTFALTLAFTSWNTSYRALSALSSLDQFTILLVTVDSAAHEASVQALGTKAVSSPARALEVTHPGPVSAAALPSSGVEPSKGAVAPASRHRGESATPPPATSTPRKRSIF